MQSGRSLASFYVPWHVHNRSIQINVASEPACLQWHQSNCTSNLILGLLLQAGHGPAQLTISLPLYQLATLSQLERHDSKTLRLTNYMLGTDLQSNCQLEIT